MRLPLLAVGLVMVMSGCGMDEVQLRQQQARQLQNLCVSLLTRSGAGEATIDRIRREPPVRFRVTGRAGSVGGIGVIRTACA